MLRIGPTLCAIEPRKGWGTRLQWGTRLRKGGHPAAYVWAPAKRRKIQGCGMDVRGWLTIPAELASNFGKVFL
jgi:hypothetical protein